MGVEDDELKKGIRKMPEGNQPGDRWAVLEKTTPSGKTMFRCLSCGSEAISPEKVCWKTTPEDKNNDTGFPSSKREPRIECMVWQKHKLHTYRLDSVKGEGWAWIVISSTGYFSAVSDLGNYAFFWTHHGYKDFRQFLYNAHKNWDYFCSKLSYGAGNKYKEYDGTATYELIKQTILDSRRMHGGGRWTKEFAREEWDLLHDECERVETEGSWDHWARNTKISDAWEYHCERWPGTLERFCKETLKRLTEEHLHKELEREGLLADARR